MNIFDIIPSLKEEQDLEQQVNNYENDYKKKKKIDTNNNTRKKL